MEKKGVSNTALVFSIIGALAAGIIIAVVVMTFIDSPDVETTDESGNGEIATELGQVYDECSFGKPNSEDCYQAMGEYHSDSNVCGDIERTGGKYCLIGTALSEDDISFCENPDLDTQAHDRCYFSFAVQREDVSLCEQMADNRLTCFERLYELTNDPSICETLGESEEYQEDNCYESLALQTGNFDYCEELQDVLNRIEKCKRDVARAIYLDPDMGPIDISECEEIPAPESTGTTDNPRYDCFMYAAWEHNDQSICEMIDVEPHMEGDDCEYRCEKSTCLIDFARRNADESICDDVTGENQYMRCRAAVSGAQGDISYCETETFSDTFTREDCYYTYATKSENWEACMNVNDDDDREDCYRDAITQSRIRIKLGSSEEAPHQACEFVSTGTGLGEKHKRQSCVQDAAITLEDPGLCDDRPSEEVLDCKARVNGILSDSVEPCLEIEDQLDRTNCVASVLQTGLEGFDGIYY